MKEVRQFNLLACALALLSLSSHAQQIQVNKDNRTIAITTSDTARANADIAQVHIGFTAYAADEKTAYANAAEISNSIIDSIVRSGVGKVAIQSDEQTISEQQIYQQENMPEAERRKRKFLVSQSWTVSTSAKDAAEVLNTAISSGANNSGVIDWDVKNGDALQAEAAAKALQHARQIADQMAKGLNATLGALVYASNEVPLTPIRKAMFNTDSASLSTKQQITKPLNISAQQVTKSATVYAVFALQ